MIQSVIAFLLAHRALEAGLVVAVLDLLFAVYPGVKANGILHFVYDKLVGLKG